MQTLGLGPPTRSEGWLKTLFWPSVTDDADVDHLTTQGFWICCIVAAMTVAVSVFSGEYGGIIDGLFFFLGGNGVRRRSIAAAALVFVVYVMGAVVVAIDAYARGGFGQTTRIFLSALLLSNVRAIWIASRWPSGARAEYAALDAPQTFGDKLSDSWPAFLWPKTRVIFYVFAGLELAGFVFQLSHRGQ